MLQDVFGRGTGSKKCFKMSLAEALGVRHLCQRHLEACLAPSASTRVPLPETC